MSNTDQNKDLKDMFAAIYLCGIENGLGKRITDPDEINHRKEAFINANPVCKEATALFEQAIEEARIRTNDLWFTLMIDETGYEKARAYKDAIEAQLSTNSRKVE